MRASNLNGDVDPPPHKKTQEPNSLNFCGGGLKESLLSRKERDVFNFLHAFFLCW